MISRRKIISRSLDNLDEIGPNANEEQDVWYDTEKLFRDHINEVLAKWEQIDDEIWAKIVIFEKNRRVAKAYARSSVISINGSKHGFDGVRIGLNGFENPMRDSQTKLARKSIGDGFKIKMDDVGNIYIKRYGKSAVFIHSTLKGNEATVIDSDVMQMSHMSLQSGASAKLFDMQKYNININREFSRTYPESSRLERQCLSAISLVKTHNNLINSPLWILVINVVAIDMLKNRLQTMPKSLDAMGMQIFASGSENPYSTIDSQVDLVYPTTDASDVSNNSSQSKNSTKRRHRSPDFLKESPYMPKPDYEIFNQSISMLSNKQKKSVHRKKQDDPYYCGLLAHIPNFIKSSKQVKKESKIFRKISGSQQLLSHPMPIAAFHQYHPHLYYPLNHRLSQSQVSIWDSRSLISAYD